VIVVEVWRAFCQDDCGKLAVVSPAALTIGCDYVRFVKKFELPSSIQETKFFTAMV